MSKHSIQRYRERGPGTLPAIVLPSNRCLSGAVVATLLPLKGSNARSPKESVAQLLPYMERRRNPMGSLPTEIISIFNHCKNMMKKINEERCKRQRLVAYRKRGYHDYQESFFLRPKQKKNAMEVTAGDASEKHQRKRSHKKRASEKEVKTKDNNKTQKNRVKKSRSKKANKKKWNKISDTYCRREGGKSW
mmetsp:Transcript_14322/g.21028  ORF Transcript_14322/g.21028 Transcript_14322/m.21028 type:complete len:191 (+) Transcript_14322:1018-1590(+)